MFAAGSSEANIQKRPSDLSVLEDRRLHDGNAKPGNAEAARGKPWRGQISNQVLLHDI